MIQKVSQTAEDSIVEKLQLLLTYYPVAFYDLVETCRFNYGKQDDDETRVSLDLSTIAVFNSHKETYNGFESAGLPNRALMKVVATRVRGKGARLRLILAEAE